MKYTYEIYPDIKIISVRLFGELYTKEVALMDKEIRSRAKELNFKIVFDFRDTKNHMSYVDAYYWFHEVHNTDLFNLKDIYVAKITNKDDEPFFRFFGLTSNNKGSRIEICEDEISALQWLEQF